MSSDNPKERVMAILADGGPHHVRAIAEKSGIPIGEVHRQLGFLKKEGRAWNDWLPRGQWEIRRPRTLAVEVSGPLSDETIARVQKWTTTARSGGLVRHGVARPFDDDINDPCDGLMDIVRSLCDLACGDSRPLRGERRIGKRDTEGHRNAAELAIMTAANLLRWVEFHAIRRVAEREIPVSRGGAG